MSGFDLSDVIVERPSSQRVWVVRASGGTFVGHFRDAGIVAIGHLNGLNLPNGAISIPPAKQIISTLRQTFPDKTQQSLASHANQVHTFANEIKQDDLVVTVDSDNLMVGRVSGSVYVDSTPVVKFRFDNQPYKMEHRLRRAVSWGPLLSRKSVPTALEMTLLAHQTVFNLDKYWAAVYHLMYPCFMFENKLYLSANIRQKENLDNYSIAQFFGMLSGVEVMAKTFGQADPATYPQLATSVGDLTLTSKAEFMSPGTVWSMVQMIGPDLIWATVIYIMLFGGDIKIFKADGLIDKQTRQRLLDCVLKLKETHDFNRVQKKLRVEVPALDTTPLEIPKERKPQRPRVKIKSDEKK